MLKPKPPLALLVTVAIVSLGLLAYSQLVAYWGDESLHLVAGQLVNAGQRPYLDFFYHHPPLFLYLVAGLMRVFGENWRVVHLFSGLLVSGSMLLIGTYVCSRVKDSELRVLTGVTATVLLGLNAYVVSFGTVALPYGFCLFLMVAAFFLITESVKRPGWVSAFGAGVCAAAAAASYLLAGPLIPILFFWLVRHNQKGSLKGKCAGYLLGIVVAFIPLLRLTAHSPHQVWIDLVQYHLFHRAGRDLGLWFNLREIAGWFISVQGAVLVAFAVAGLLAIKSRAEFDERVGPELRLALWLALAMAVLICFARPTLSFYFVLITPFVAILASFGVSWACLRVRKSFRYLCVVLVLVVYVAGLSAHRYIWLRQTSYADHRVVRNIARVVDEVTPNAGMIYAFEAVYFEAHRLPPPGLENRFNPASPADEWLKDGRFDTICIGSTNPRLERFKLLERYGKRQTVVMNGYDFYVLWEKTSSVPSTEARK